jgi:hypothetical protein
MIDPEPDYKEESQHRRTQSAVELQLAAHTPGAISEASSVAMTDAKRPELVLIDMRGDDSVDSSLFGGRGVRPLPYLI